MSPTFCGSERRTCARIDSAMALTKQQAERRIQKLREQIEHHNYLYYTLDQPEIADAQWDALYRELVELEARFPELVAPDSPTQKVGGTPLREFAEVAHRFRMWSLDNAFSIAELREGEVANVTRAEDM